MYRISSGASVNYPTASPCNFTANAQNKNEITTLSKPILNTVYCKTTDVINTVRIATLKQVNALETVDYGLMIAIASTVTAIGLYQLSADIVSLLPNEVYLIPQEVYTQALPGPTYLEGFKFCLGRLCVGPI